MNTAIPASLDNLLDHVLCAAAAPSQEGYRDALSRNGFDYVKIRTVNWALSNMMQTIRRRLSLLMSDPAGIGLPPDWGDPMPALAELEDFVATGGGGYLIATARRR